MLCQLIEESYNYNKILEEQSRFWKEMEKMPLDKRVDAIRKLWGSDTERAVKAKNNIPVSSVYGWNMLFPQTDAQRAAANTRDNLNLYTAYKDFINKPEEYYQDLKKSFRQADKPVNEYYQNNNRKLFPNGIDHAYERTKKQFVNDKNLPNANNNQYFIHAGAKNYLEDFMANRHLGGTSNSGGLRGIQVSRNSNPIDSHDFIGYSHRAFLFGDEPAIIKGKAPLYKLDPSGDSDYSLLKAGANLPKSDYKIESVPRNKFSYMDLQQHAPEIIKPLQKKAKQFVDIEKHDNLPENQQVFKSKIDDLHKSYYKRI